MYSQSELATFRHASSNVTLMYNTLLPTFSGKKKSNATRQIRSKSNTSTRKHKDPCANQVVPVKENSCHASASPPNENGKERRHEILFFCSISFVFESPFKHNLNILHTKNKCIAMIYEPRHEETFFFFFCICENKDADQLRGNHEADQRLCFRYTDSSISLLPKSEISSL